ncbi:MAG: hypothetical protein ABSF45_15965 [Terriglobia bacterium]|jgi:hypothetical protein
MRKLRSKPAIGKAPGAGFIGSPTSARRVKERWRLEFQLENCRAQIGLWERNLATAKEGVKRQSAQLSAGRGAAHLILQTYTDDVAKAERMIAAFKQNTMSLQEELAALVLTPEQAAKRKENQDILAALVLARVEGDKQLDGALSTVFRLLYERQQVTAKMRERALVLEFERGVDLDDARFEALLRALPKDMACESAKWASWFLGTEADRTPYMVSGGDFCLDETLASCNGFRSGDTPSLTEKERRELERQKDSLYPPSAAGMERLANIPPKKAEQSTGKIQWGLAPGAIV